MKKARTLIILCLVLVAMIGALVAVKAAQKKSEERASQKAIDETIHVGDITTADSISFVSPEGQELSFSLRDGTWVYDNDSDFPVNQTAVTKIAGLVENCTASRKFENADLNEYGLSSPTFTLTVGQGGDSATFMVSEKKGDVCYVTLDNKTVYVVSSDFDTNLSHGFLDFLQKDTLTQADRENISTLTLTYGDKALTLVGKKGTYSDEASWYVVSGGTETKTEDITLTDSEASATAIAKNALDVFDSWRVGEVAEYKPENTDIYGFNNPLTVTVEYKESDNDEVKSFTASLGTDGQGWYVIPQGSSIVYKLSDSFAQPLVTAIEQLG